MKSEKERENGREGDRERERETDRQKDGNIFFQDKKECRHCEVRSTIPIIRKIPFFAGSKSTALVDDLNTSASDSRTANWQPAGS